MLVDGWRVPRAGACLIGCWLCACSSLNPEFNGSADTDPGPLTATGAAASTDSDDDIDTIADSDTNDDSDTIDDGLTADGGSDPTTGPGADGSTSGAGSLDDAGGEDTTGESDVFVHCPGVIYAATDDGQLLLVDLGSGGVIDTQPLGWETDGIATDVSTGEVLYTPRVEAGPVSLDTVVRHDPDSGSDNVVGDIGAPLFDPVGRATMSDGVLWLATNGPFQQLLAVQADDPSAQVGMWPLPQLPQLGGDFIMLSASELMMVTGPNEARIVNIDGGMVEVSMPTMIEAVNSPLTGLAREGDGMLWASDIDGTLYRLDSPYEPSVVHTITIEDAPTDLAPVWALSMDCPPT